MVFESIYQYNFPTTIRFGAGSSKELGDYLLKNKLSKPLVVTDGTVAGLSFFKEIITDLGKKNISVEIFSGIHKNPVKSDVYKGTDMYDETRRDAIIGIGGGAALDVARAIVLRVNHREDLFKYDDLIGGDVYVTNDVPHFITIPTTAGTGSEVGRSAIIADDETHQKKILFSPKLLAKIVFADPVLTMELPAFITAATGMDALTHNMEAYLAKMPHPLCEGIALEGISLIHQSLEKAVNKPEFSENLPGCGGHVHQSLWDKKGTTNLFYDAKDKLKMSSLLKSYLAGQLYCLPHILPLVAPTINSYKRLVEGAWAPTTLTWGIDNRTVAFRALPGNSKSCRLETRVIGSDVNPYLAMAACLASGLYGIKKKLKLNQPATIGNGYKDYSNGILPSTLIEATRQMKASKLANDLLGEKFVEHFVQTREWEWQQHLKAVTDWEYKRYFEII